MSFVSLIPHLRQKPKTDSFRIGVEKHHVVFKPARQMMKELGWEAGHTVDCQIGQAEHAGLVRLAPDPKGWTIKKSGGDSNTLLVIKVRRNLFRDLPERVTTVATAAVLDEHGAIMVALPWHPGAQIEVRKDRAGQSPYEEPENQSRANAGDSAKARPAEAGVDPASRLAGGRTPALAPRGQAQTSASGVTGGESAATKPLSPPPPRDNPDEVGAFGRMSLAQTDEFVQAVARGAKRADLIKIVTAPPARYGSGTIDYLKEKLAHRIAAVIRVAEPAVFAPKPLADTAQKPISAENPQNRAPNQMQASVSAIQRPAAEARMQPAEPAPGIPEPIMKFLRDEVVPGLAALGHRMTKNDAGTQLYLHLAGQPKRPITPEALVAEANRLLERDEDDLLTLPSAA